MVLLKTTPTIAAALHAISPSARAASPNLPRTPPAVGAPISHDAVVSLARICQEHDNSSSNSSSNSNSNSNRNGNDTEQEQKKEREKYTLNELLRGSDVYTPPPPPRPEPTPEYLALKQKLQTLAEEQAYAALVAPSKNPSSYSPSPIFTTQEQQQQQQAAAEEAADSDPLSPSLVLNIFMSVILCGFATFWALKNFQTPEFLTLAGSSTRHKKPVVGTAAAAEPVFVLVSIFVGLLVGVAEVVVYAAYLRKVEQAKQKERRVRERKEVIREDIQVGDGNAEKEHVEKEEIWGKGVNGGVRRRVRERWQG